jgi:hypothetical protein
MEETVRKCDWCGKEEKDCLQETLVCLTNEEEVCFECLGIRPTRKRPVKGWEMGWNTSATPWCYTADPITITVPED